MIAAKTRHGDQEGEEVCAGAMLEDDVGYVLSRLAEAGGCRALLIIHAIHLHDGRRSACTPRPTLVRMTTDPETHLHDVGVDELGKRHEPFELFDPARGLSSAPAHAPLVTTARFRHS